MRRDRKLHLEVLFGIFSIVFSLLFMINFVVKIDQALTTKESNMCETRTEVYNDLIDGYVGAGYNLEENYYSTSVNARSIDNRNSCIHYCSTHGPGRHNGGYDLLSVGCRNYKGWSYENYGRLDIPYWINMQSMNTITNITHRNLLISDIREQAQQWNRVVVHDGANLKVNLYEVGVGSTTRPSDINGLKVVEFLREDGDYAGQFNPNELQIKINYDPTFGGNRPGRNIDTPMHEMGHLLGLMDLETDESGIARGTHKTLMSYNRGTTSSTINKAIQYSDIQGVAVFNSLHTNHSFYRYVLQDGQYLHICFYCDRIDARSKEIYGSGSLSDSSTCIHDYQDFVSAGDRYWSKCTKCYKVIEEKCVETKYTITLVSHDNIVDEITVHYGEEVVFDYAPIRQHYEFKGYYEEPNGQGKCYVRSVLNQWSNGIFRVEAESTGERWYQYSDGVLYAYWERIQADIEYDVISLNDEMLTPRSVFIVSGQDTTITAPALDGYTFDHWSINDVNYTTATVTVNLELHRSYLTGEITLYKYNGTSGTYNDGYMSVSYTKNPEDSCVAAGTLITLADGRQVPVETLTGNEMLLVWNLYTGSFDVAPILFIDRDAAAIYKVINLYFSDGTQVKVISEHAFWDFNLNQYVFLREDAAQYVGHWFNKQTKDVNGNMIWMRVQLTNVTITEEYTTAWSPVTYGHLCIYVNGMLSMPGATEGLINIFEVDGDTMKIDQEQYLADIATYGLFAYEEFAEICPVPEEMFNAVNGQYLKVSIGKGLIDYETLGELIERYSEFFN